MKIYDFDFHLSQFCFIRFSFSISIVLKFFLLLSRYWNDKEVLQKLGEAMGLAVVGDGTTSADNSVPDETEEPGNEDESVVHHTASVGDVEVLSIYYS